MRIGPFLSNMQMSLDLHTIKLFFFLGASGPIIKEAKPRKQWESNIHAVLHVPPQWLWSVQSSRVCAHRCVTLWGSDNFRRREQLCFMSTSREVKRKVQRSIKAPESSSRAWTGFFFWLSVKSCESQLSQERMQVCRFMVRCLPVQED